MFKTFRMVVEKTSSGSEEDINDKRKLKELEAAVVSLQRTQAFYLKSFVDLSANAAAFHVDLANVYPAGEMLSTSVMQLNASGGVFKDAPATAEQIREAFAKPVADILARIKDLSAKADERQVVRAEIGHYRDKVARLANDGLHNVKSQNKAESNQEKLLRNQTRFRELDEEVNASLSALDHAVAEATNAAIARFVQLQATFASGLLHCYGNAMAAIPGGLKAGGAPASVVLPAGAGGADAAAAAAAPALGGAGAAAAGGAGAGGAGSEPHSARGSFVGGSAAGAAGAGAGGVITDARALFPADEEPSSAAPAAAVSAPAAAAPAPAEGDGPAAASGGARVSMSAFLGGGSSAAETSASGGASGAVGADGGEGEGHNPFDDSHHA